MIKIILIGLAILITLAMLLVALAFLTAWLGDKAGEENNKKYERK